MGFFDSDQEDDGGFEALPPGRYQVIVEEPRIKDNSKGTGRFASIRLSVQNDQYANRKIFDNFNIEHTSEQAQRIGRGQFARFLKAIDHPKLESEEEIFELADSIVDVEISRETDNRGREVNRVLKYIGADESTEASPSPTQNVASDSAIDDVPF